MSIRLDERRYVEELKWLVADFRMWKNPLVPLPDGFEDDLAWRSYRVFGQTSPADIIALAVRTRDEDLVAQGEGFISDSVSMKSSGGELPSIHHAEKVQHEELHEEHLRQRL